MAIRYFSVVCHLLLLFSVTMAIFTVITTSVSHISTSEWGLVAKFPIQYWIGLISLVTLTYLGKESKGWLIVVFILTIAYLYCVPTLLLENATLLGTSYPAAEGELIGINGKFVPDKFSIYRYHNFPGFLYLVAVMTSLTSIPLTTLCKYIPLLTITIYGLSIYLILNVKLKTRESLIGTIWFLSSFWVIENYFSPQSISFIFFLLTFLIVTWLFLDREVQKKSRRLATLVFFLFSFSVLTHPLTSILLVLYVVTLSFVHKMKIKPITYIMGILFVLMQFVYLLSEAYPFLNYAILEIFAEFPNLFELQFRRVGGTGSLYNTLTNISRISIMATNVLIALVVVILSAYRRSKNDDYKYWLSSLFGFSILAFISAYGHSEMLARLYMFALVPLTYLCTMFLSSRKPILCVIVCILLTLHIPAHYGGASFEMVTNSEIVGAAFYLKSIPRNASYFSLSLKTTNLMRFQEPASVGTPYFISHLSAVNATTVKAAIEKSEFVICSQSDVNKFLYYTSVDPINESHIDQEFHRVYDNPYIQFYMHK